MHDTLEGMVSSAPLGLLLDVDGPIASPVTRSVPDEVLERLVRLAHRGVPICFNTGRAADFVLRELVLPLRAAGLREESAVFAVCERAGTWFPFSAVPADVRPDAAAGATAPAWLGVDGELRLEEAVQAGLREVNERIAGPLQPFDPMKFTMVSFEKARGADDAQYLPRRDAVARALRDWLAAQGLAERVEVEATVISVDVQDRRSGKALGARRCARLMEEAGLPLPARWITAGDSASDYAMAEELRRRGEAVQHVDVRPTPDSPATDVEVLTAADLAEAGHGSAEDVDERVGASLLAWAEALLDGGGA